MIVYFLACIGATFILKYGTILNPVRKILYKWPAFEELFKCSLCLGFWVGLYFGILACFIEEDIKFIFLCFVSPCICWFADTIITLLQTIDIYLEKKLEDDN